LKENKDGLTVWRKIQGSWVVEIGGRISRIGVAGDICLRRPRATQGCRADDDDDDEAFKEGMFSIVLVLVSCYFI
jgi:hypothetical protein